MKRFACDCGQRVFFENTSCVQCQKQLGYDPFAADMITLTQSDAGPNQWYDRQGQFYQHCYNRVAHRACNWLIRAASAETDQALCLGCSMNGTIPNLAMQQTRTLWQRMERAKRRLLYGLLRLQLPLTAPPLTFHFLQDQRSNPLVAAEHINTGHYQGHITINLLEADDVERESARVAFLEANRTLLGHFRHESGHYYWLQLIDAAQRTEAFRALFGDERTDYQAAVAAHHANGPPVQWQESYVSAYASSHPHEDWAETWGHYLHIIDALESAEVNGLLGGNAGGSSTWIDQWLGLSVALNEVNRSIGVDDAYPFALTDLVVEKLQFIHSVVVPLAAAEPTAL